MNSIKKRVLLISLLFLIDSCSITNWWLDSGKDKYEEIETMLIDHQKKRIILIGEAGYATKTGTYHYSVASKRAPTFEIFKIGLKSKDGVYADLDRAISFVGTSEVSGGSWMSFDYEGLPESDIKYLKNLDLNEVVHRYKEEAFGFYYGRNKNSKITRYPSSKEKFTNFCSKTNKDPDCSPIIKLKKPWKGRISRSPGWAVMFFKFSLMPVAMAADVLYSPVYIWATFKGATDK